jgi:hypothetical protein
MNDMRRWNSPRLTTTQLNSECWPPSTISLALNNSG